MPITSQDIVPFNKARADLTRLADEVRAGHEKIITRNGESYVALVDARKLDYYHQLERETLARANVQFGLLNDAAAGLQDIRAGLLRFAIWRNLHATWQEKRPWPPQSTRP